MFNSTSFKTNTIIYSLQTPPTTTTMDLSLSLNTTLPFGSQNHNPLNHYHHNPISISIKLKKLPTLRLTAKKKSTIDGISDDLNSIASLNLDFAPSRRHVREAFTHVQHKLDHFLFKVINSILPQTFFLISYSIFFRITTYMFQSFLFCVFYLIDCTFWDQNSRSKFFVLFFL